VAVGLAGTESASDGSATPLTPATRPWWRNRRCGIGKGARTAVTLALRPSRMSVEDAERLRDRLELVGGVGVGGSACMSICAEAGTAPIIARPGFVERPPCARLPAGRGRTRIAESDHRLPPFRRGKQRSACARHRRRTLTACRLISHAASRKRAASRPRSALPCGADGALRHQRWNGKAVNA
jgi:hypothetical protein